LPEFRRKTKEAPNDDCENEVAFNFLGDIFTAW
jgi:hypothetical protein